MGAGRRLFVLIIAAGYALAGAPAIGQNSANYQYDEAGRLKSVTYLDGTQTIYGLDAAGNRLNVGTGKNTTPPGAPATVGGTAPASTQVNLTWTASSTVGFLAGYKIYRNGAYLGSVVGTPPVPPPTNYTDTTTTCNTSYSYTVVAYDTSNPPNVSAASPAWSVTPPTTIPPSVPTGLAYGSVTAAQVVLSWSASSDPCGSAIGGYKIYRNGAQISTSTSTGYTDSTAAGATTYTYTVAAYDSVTPTPNTSAPSTGVPVTTLPNAPGAPTATAVEPNFVTISWSAVSGAALSGYKIYRNSSLLASVPAGTVSYNDTTTSGTTTYNYAVSAYDSAGESAQTAAPSVTTPYLYQITDAGGQVLAPVRSFYTAAGPVPGSCGVIPGAGPCQYFVYQAYGSKDAVRTSTNSIQACPYNDVLAPGYTVGTGNNCLATFVTPAALGQPSASSTPTGLTATATSATSVSLSWTASTDVGGPGLAGYQVYRNGSLLASTTGASPTYVDSTASCNKSYSYTVAGYDTATPPDVSAPSAAASVTTPIALPPSVPTGLATSSVGPTQVVLTWTASTDPCGVPVAGYQIYRDGVQISTSATPGYTDTGLYGATTYNYTVVAYDSSSAANASAQSSALAVTTPPQPYQITDTLGNVISQASSLYRSAIVPAVCGPTSGNGPCNYVVTQTYGSQQAVRTDSNGLNNFVAPGYSIGSGAGYKVTYATAATFGGYLPPGTPTNLTGSAASSSQVNLSWTASTDTSGVLAGYQIFRNGTQIATTAATTYSDTSTTCNASYSYTVRAYDTFSPPDVSGQSSAFSLTTPITVPPSVPTGLASSSVTASQVVLTWSASSDPCGVSIGGYRIYRNGTQIATSSSTSYTDTGVISATPYSYTVAAYDSTSQANASGQSSAVSVTTSPQPFQITDSLGNVISNASSLYRSAIVPAVCGPSSGNGPCQYVVTQKYGSQLAVRTDSNGINSFLAPGYSIGSGASYMATFATAATYGGYLPPSTPTGLTGSAASQSQVNLSWSASTDTSGVLAGYQVFRNGAQIATTAATSYSDTSTTCNTGYSYTVRAYDAFSPPDFSGLSSAFSLTTPITVPPSVPSGLGTSSVTASQVVLVWNASSDGCSAVAGYRIYRNGTQIGTSSSTSYTDTTVAGGTTYSYTVAAYDSTSQANTSGQSSALGVTTPASIYHITDANGNSLSSLYATKVVPAVCGPGSGNGPCNYVVTQTYGSQQAVRIDTNGLNSTLAPGYTIGSGSDYKSTYATAAVYGK